MAQLSVDFHCITINDIPKVEAKCITMKELQNRHELPKLGAWAYITTVSPKTPKYTVKVVKNCTLKFATQ